MWVLALGAFRRSQCWNRSISGNMKKPHGGMESELGWFFSRLPPGGVPGNIYQFGVRLDVNVNL